MSHPFPPAPPPDWRNSMFAACGVVLLLGALIGCVLAIMAIAEWIGGGN